MPIPKGLSSQEIYDDYKRSKSTIVAVAKRHGISGSTAGYHIKKWEQHLKNKKKGHRSQTQKGGQHAQTEGHIDSAEAQYHVAFACGYTKARLDAYAESCGLPAAYVTAGVAAFLRKSSSR